MTIITSANATGAALIAMTQIQSGAAVSTTSLASALAVLTPAQIANLTVSKQLSEVQLMEALNTAKLGIAKEREIWLAHNAAIAKMADKGATDALAFSMKNLWVACKPFLILAAITAAVTLLYKAWDKANITAEEQRGIFNDLQTTYNETKSTLESLKDEYDSVNEKLAELNRLASLGPLTASQKEEQLALQEKSAELERQIKLQEKLVGVQEKATNDAAYEALIKRRNKIDGLTMRRGSEIISSGGGSEMSDVDAIQYYLDKLEDATERKNTLDEEFAAKTNPTTQDAAEYTAAIQSIETEMANYESKISDIVTAVTPFLNSITDTSGAAYDLKVALEAVIDKWVNFGSGADNAAVALSNIVTTTYRIFPELETHVKSLTTIESEITKLRDALADFRDDGYVTMDAFSDMAETLGKSPDEFEHFVTVASNSKSTMGEVQTAASELAKAYLQSTDFLANLTDGTVKSTIATLKNIGVVNAEEVVLERLAIAEAAAALESAGLTDASWDQITAHFKSADAAEVSMEAIRALYVEQLNTRIAAIDFKTATGDVIDALYKEAQAANITGEAFEALGKIQRLKQRAATHTLDEYEANNFGDLMDLYESQLNAALDSFEIELDFSTAITPTPSSGKTAAEKAAEEVRDAFAKAYNAKKHELDMERITIEEFYAWLDDDSKGYKAYFKKQGETLEDFQKYSKEVFDGLREVHQQYLDVLDFEISTIERSEDSENQLIAKYEEKRAAVTELIQELRKYLELQGATEQEILSNEQYRSYMNMMYSIADEIASIQDAVYEKKAGYINDLIDLTEELVKQETEDYIDTLEEEKDIYSDLIAQRKELINATRKQDTYERDRQKKLQEIQKLQERIAALDLDESRAAALEKQALLEELSEKQLELDDLQTEHYIESAEKALDDKEKAVHDEYDREIKELEEFLDNNAALNEAAMAELDNMNQDLFDRLESYASHYTDTTRDELLKMWEEATEAAEKYGSIANAAKVYEDSDVNNAVKTQLDRMRRNGQEYGTASAERQQWLADDSLKAGAELQRLLGVTVERDDYTGVWWIGDGANRRKLFEIYHTGTPSVGGNATIKQNETFALLEKGESVLTKNQTNVLWEALKTFDLTKKLSASIAKLTPGHVTTESKQDIKIEVVMQPTIYGDATDMTMGVIRKEARNVADIVAAKIR